MDNNRKSWGYTRGHTRLKSGKGSSFSMFPSFLLRPCQISLKERYQWLQSTRWFELDRQMTEPQTVLSWKGITRFIKSSSWPCTGPTPRVTTRAQSTDAQMAKLQHTHSVTLQQTNPQARGFDVTEAVGIPRHPLQGLSTPQMQGLSA